MNNEEMSNDPKSSLTALASLIREEADSFNGSLAHYARLRAVANKLDALAPQVPDDWVSRENVNKAWNAIRGFDSGRSGEELHVVLARMMAAYDALAVAVVYQCIECPLCGVTVKQASSATLSLALWQHVQWVCEKGRSDTPAGAREALEDLDAYGQGESAAALTKKDRDQYQLWQGWCAALDRMRAALPVPALAPTTPPRAENIKDFGSSDIRPIATPINDGGHHAT